MNIFTPRQLNVMHHAVAFPKFTRNTFHATNGSINHETCDSLVVEGMAELVSFHGGIRIYKLTPEAITVLRETL